MLFFLYGDNKDRARAKAHELMDTLAKKRPEAELFKLEVDNFSSAQIEELVGGQGLFSNKYIVFLDGLFENVEIKEQVLKFYKEIGSSENVFIWLESKVDKPTLIKIEKVAKKVQKFESKGETERKFSTDAGQFLSIKDFNIFDLANALARKDKKGLWILYREAIERNYPPEEINGILFWKVKDLLVKQSRYFKTSELKDLARKFVETYHNAHRGKHDFEIALERLILSL